MKVKNVYNRPITIRGVRIEPDQIADVEEIKNLDDSMIRRIKVVKEVKTVAGKKSRKKEVIENGDTMV